jgi:hypothetical protein
MCPNCLDHKHSAPKVNVERAGEVVGGKALVVERKQAEEVKVGFHIGEGRSSVGGKEVTIKNKTAHEIQRGSGEEDWELLDGEVEDDWEDVYAKDSKMCERESETFEKRSGGFGGLFKKFFS